MDIFRAPRRRLVGVAVVLLALLTAGLGFAWGPPNTTRQDVAVLDTVTSVEVAPWNSSQQVIRITGTATATTTPVSLQTGITTAVVESCHRAALLMMSRPGRYRLRLTGAPGTIMGDGCALDIR